MTRSSQSDLLPFLCRARFLRLGAGALAGPLDLGQVEADREIVRRLFRLQPSRRGPFDDDPLKSDRLFEIVDRNVPPCGRFLRVQRPGIDVWLCRLRGCRGRCAPVHTTSAVRHWG